MSNLTYSGGEIDLSNPLSMSSYEEIQNGYKKLASTSLQRTNLYFYPFFQISQTSKTLNDFHPPKVFTMFPNPREPLKRTLIKDPQP